ncbi:MAG TPA: hypothetical protein VK902_06125 [Rubrobacter sp.]|nr:hypothetical protein [Rubrobacter sp.]
MHEIESLIFLLAAAALLAQLARLLMVPYPILLVLGGLVPGLPNIEIPPEVIFVPFLPPLLNSAAFSSSPLDLRADKEKRYCRYHRVLSRAAWSTREASRLLL